MLQKLRTLHFRSILSIYAASAVVDRHGPAKRIAVGGTLHALHNKVIGDINKIIDVVRRAVFTGGGLTNLLSPEIQI